MQIMKTSHGLLPRARCSSKKRAQVHTHSFLTDALRLFPSPKPKQPAEVKLILDKIEGGNSLVVGRGGCTHPAVLVLTL
eukprot:scaffold244308_cov14-Tisochrysis_lutea.AAC.1